MHNTLSSLLTCIALSLLATACGGGGGGGGSSTETSPPIEPTPPAAATFTLSGIVTTSDSQLADSDTNDPTRQAVGNDTPATAQAVPSPATLGGYINQPGTGAEGRSQLSGDTDDFFAVDLLAGQRITLLVSDFEQADADLYLFDTQGNILDFSAGIGEVESLLVTRDGTYLVNAFAFEGATNYILAIGAPNTPNEYTAAAPDIIPWEAVVAYQDGAQVASTAAPEFTRRLGMTQRAGGRDRARLMALHRGFIDAQQMQQRLGSAAAKMLALHDTPLRARWETLMAIKALRKDPAVRYAEPNYRMRASAVPNDDAYPLQWHYPLIGLPQAWDTTAGDPGVVVAVVDTGILANHPDLAGLLTDGYDFVRDPSSALDGDGIDPDPQDPGGSSVGGGSDSFHGTHVSGTIAARGNNQLGGVGTAYGSRVMPVRALGVGGEGTSYDVDQAIRFAAGLSNDSGTVPAEPAQIINLSLGGAPFSQASQELFNQVRAAGILVVAAAGNEASSAPSYPASYDGVISVSAVDAQRRLTAYSNIGPRVDVAAPGGDNSVDLNGDGYPDGILSTGGTINDSTVTFVYSFLNGTSMAAPHVAGVLALMKSVNPFLQPDDIDALLTSGLLSDDLGVPGRDDQYGHGIINAQRSVVAALEAAGSSVADNPRLISSASTLNFGSSTTALTLVLSNGGKGDLALLNIAVSEPWLALEPVNVDGAGLGEYTVSVTRDSLPPGIYAADITAQSSVNVLNVRVLVSAGNPNAGADLGVIYILLYDPLAEETVAQFATAGNGTNYPYRFTDVPEGRYEILAGTDADNDLFICDAGEACGAWLTLDQPIDLSVDSDRDALNFPVEYLLSLPNSSTAANNGLSSTPAVIRPRQTIPGRSK